MRFPVIFSVFLPLAAVAQTITPVQQKALNNYIEYANKSSEEINSLVKSIREYYPALKRHQSRPSMMVPRYTCPSQPEDYFFNKALQESPVLGSAINYALKSNTEDLKAAAGRIDAVCKSLDTYHKLEDYKKDNFAKAEELVKEFPALLTSYRQAQHVLMNELTASFKKLQVTIPGNPYHIASQMMLEQIAKEKAVIDLWTYNLEASVHTGWPVDKLEASIPETDKQLKAFNETTPSLEYPASSMYSSFKNALANMVETKRSALDGYNAEAKKSDLHSNQVYLDLINYYNGTLVSDYNTFIQFSQQDGYYGLKMITYCQTFDLRAQAKEVHVKAEPFRDIVYPAVDVSPRQNPASKAEASALNNYVDFINECLRQTDFLRVIVRNFNSMASYYKSLASFEGHGGMHFDFEKYALPLSSYQKMISGSSALPAPYTRSLNGQAEILLNILREMELLASVLETETKEKRYEQDHLEHIYQIMERYHTLFEIVDVKKEQLYQDVRAVADSYPIADPGNPWIISWRALRLLTDYDHTALFQAKDFYKKKNTLAPATTDIDTQLREVISKEFANMKGIEKLGRYNGLCPYTPYEDIPATSRLLSEKLVKVPDSKPSYNRHPYHDLVYLYNEVVDDYNKFCGLSKLELLKQIRQPEFFEIKYPEKAAPRTENSQHPVQATTGQEHPDAPVPEVKITATEDTKVIYDTVYIEKHDTVYLEPGEELRSMEGYAVNNMVLLLDVSGSMNALNKLPLLKKSVLNMLGMMRPEDQVSIIIYSGKAKVLLQPTSFKEEEKIRKVIDNLRSTGKTDGNAGIKLAYQVADKNYVRGGNNRIILATDGEFAISDEIMELAEKFSGQDIFLSVFNFGTGNTSAKNLERISHTGRGNYERITSENVEFKLIQEAKSKRKK